MGAPATVPDSLRRPSNGSMAFRANVVGVPIVEAMTALVLAGHALCHRARYGTAGS